MTEALLAPSELDTMAGLLKHLAEVFNRDGVGMDEGGMMARGMEPTGMAAVAAALVDVGCLLRGRHDESAVELVAYWLEKRNYRVPLE